MLPLVRDGAGRGLPVDRSRHRFGPCHCRPGGADAKSGRGGARHVRQDPHHHDAAAIGRGQWRRSRQRGAQRRASGDEGLRQCRHGTGHQGRHGPGGGRPGSRQRSRARGIDGDPGPGLCRQCHGCGGNHPAGRPHDDCVLDRHLQCPARRLSAVLYAAGRHEAHHRIHPFARFALDNRLPALKCGRLGQGDRAAPGGRNRRRQRAGNPLRAFRRFHRGGRQGQRRDDGDASTRSTFPKAAKSPTPSH